MSSTAIFHRTTFEEQPKLQGRRPVILHFHTYKNAGSTVDAILERCFPGSWASFDFHAVPEFFIHHSEIANIARNRAQVKAISSHQVRLPIPDFPGIEFLPIVFVRHPILRAASIWRFERSRPDDHPRTILAREKGFREWTRHSLGGADARAICNNQAWLFSFRNDKRTIRTDPNIFQYAKANFEAGPLIGVVEEFDASMRIFERLYRPKVPEFRYEPVAAKNVTQVRKSVEQQISEIEAELGADVFQELMDRNKEDMWLYQFAAKQLMNNSSLASDDVGSTRAEVLLKGKLPRAE